MTIEHVTTKAGTENFFGDSMNDFLSLLNFLLSKRELAIKCETAVRSELVYFHNNHEK